MPDITDISIGTVFKWSKDGNPPSKDGIVKNSYFIFMGCYEDDGEFYLILFRTTARVSFYETGDRQRFLKYIFDDFHPCFSKRSATSEIDLHLFVEADRLKSAFTNGYIENLCNLKEEEVRILQNIIINSNQVSEKVKSLFSQDKIIDWLEYIIDHS